MLPASPTSNLGPAERFISLFTRIEANEARGVMALFANGFLLLLSYYLLKPVRESLILTQNSPEVRSYATAVIALVLMVLVPVYGRLFHRWGRSTLIRLISLFFIVSLVGLAALGQSGVQIGTVFFVWLGTFSVIVVAQYWALAADLYDPSQGRRLFPVIAVGVSLGAWAGSQIAALLFSITGAYGLMLIAAGVLCVTLAVGQATQRFVTADRIEDLTQNHSPKQHALGGYSLVFSDQYLCLLAVSVVLLNWINSTGDFILAKAIVNHVQALEAGGHLIIEQSELIGSIYSQYYSTVAMLGLTMQLLLVSRLFQMIGVGGASLIMPVIMVLGYALISFVPIFTVIHLSQILEKSGNYSIHNTARHALFLPVGQAAKFKAKTIIDTTLWRAGDLIQAGAIYVGQNWLSFDLGHFAVANLVLATLFLWINLAIRREYAARFPESLDDDAAKDSPGIPSSPSLDDNAVPAS